MGGSETPPVGIYGGVLASVLGILSNEFHSEDSLIDFETRCFAAVRISFAPFRVILDCSYLYHF